jgi:hypothetical protein
MLDLNQLFAGHQTALFNAQQAASSGERQTWNDRADVYAEGIRHYREQGNLPVYRWA